MIRRNFFSWNLRDACRYVSTLWIFVKQNTMNGVSLFQSSGPQFIIIYRVVYTYITRELFLWIQYYRRYSRSAGWQTFYATALIIWTWSFGESPITLRYKTVTRLATLQDDARLLCSLYYYLLLILLYCIWNFRLAFINK